MANLSSDYPLAFANLRQYQKTDPQLAPIIEELQKGISVDTYCLKEDILHCSLKPNQFRIVVPESLVTLLLQHYHVSSAGTHVGVYNTRQNIRQHFIWKGIDNDIRNFVKACKTCKPAENTKDMHRAEDMPMQGAAQASQKPLSNDSDKMWKPVVPAELDDNTRIKRMPTKEPIPLEVSNLNAISVFKAGTHSLEKRLMHTVDLWHKFIIVGGRKFQRDTVLKHIMDAVYPLDTIPVLYQLEGENSFFFARNCAPAIMKLCRANMTITLPDGSSLILRIILGFKHIRDMPLNMQQNLLKVIQKRYNKMHQSLDLSNFHKDRDLEDLIFCPLSQSKILAYVLRSAKHVSRVKEIDLSHNDITNLKTLEVQWLLSITKLNLSYNKIASVTDLELNPLPLTHLHLNHNPLCANYKDEASYISDVRSMAPSIQVLDGLELGPPGFPRIIRNHMWTKEDVRMADEFLRHYFTLYDSENRRYLLGLYHEEASFSLTAHYVPGQNTSSNARLTEYAIESRNFIRISDYSKSLKLLHRGSEDILATLCRLPRSEHDPYSFCVDLTHLPSGVVISVNGVFREPAISKEPLVRSFSRVFILVAVSPSEFQIANEMLHICNATTKQVEEAFQILKPKIATLPAKVPLNLNHLEKEQMTEIFSQLTEMNMTCSKKFLEEVRWNIRDALTAFLELYKTNKLPVEVFISH